MLVSVVCVCVCVWCVCVCVCVNSLRHYCEQLLKDRGCGKLICTYAQYCQIAKWKFIQNNGKEL